MDNQSIDKDHKANVWNTQNIFSRIDNAAIPDGENEIRLFAIARNESLRLPYFLSYYFNLGVDRIFMIDNNSTDNTQDIALQHENVHVFKIDDSFKNFWYWIEYFLESYGQNRWCLVVDIDELFSYPSAERLSLKELLNYMDINKFSAIKSLLLDMYSDKSIKDTKYLANEDPLLACPYFEPDYSDRLGSFMDKKKWVEFDYDVRVGGMRRRVFRTTEDKEWQFCLTKTSLFKYSDETYLVEGMHAINGAALADIEGVVFHTKFLYDFIQEAHEEAEREVHFSDAVEYKIYNVHVSADPNLNLLHENSIKLIDLDQLVNIRIMKSSEQFNLYVQKINQVQ